MPPVGFEPTISAGEWQQTYALDRAATGTGDKRYVLHNFLLQSYKYIKIPAAIYWAHVDIVMLLWLRMNHINTLRTGEADLRF